MYATALTSSGPDTHIQLLNLGNRVPFPLDHVSDVLNFEQTPIVVNSQQIYDIVYVYICIYVYIYICMYIYICTLLYFYCIKYTYIPR